MRMTVIAPLALMILASCGGNPFNGTPTEPTNPTTPTNPTDPTDPTTPTDPDALTPDSVRGHVTAADLAGWAPGDTTFSIRMSALDASDLSATYTRDGTLDVGPYHAYTQQTTTANRKVVALVHKAGGVAAMAAVDAGQHGDSHFGGQLWRADVFTLPASGQGQDYIYSGTYAGLLNTGAPTAGGPGGGLNPIQAYRTTGRAQITADFTEMQLTGAVDQRSVLETGDPLPTIALRQTSISANGLFAGGVDRFDPDQSSAGSYAGVFGGTNASDVAVVMVFNPLSGEAALFEQGAVVLQNCPTAGGPACP